VRVPQKSPTQRKAAWRPRSPGCCSRTISSGAAGGNRTHDPLVRSFEVCHKFSISLALIGPFSPPNALFFAVMCRSFTQILPTQQRSVSSSQAPGGPANSQSHQRHAGRFDGTNVEGHGRLATLRVGDMLDQAAGTHTSSTMDTSGRKPGCSLVRPSMSRVALAEPRGPKRPT